MSWISAKRRGVAMVELLVIAAVLLATAPIAIAAEPSAGSEIHLSTRQREVLDQLFAQRKLQAPSLDGGVGWINTAGPIELKELHGKFVLLDFWTYCCINCMHIMPELKKLEHAYPNNLVVIGVHTAKFDAEHDSKNIAEAVQRYELEHPVVNDANQVIWNRYEVSSWPTLVLIDPEGYVVYYHAGETKADTLLEFLKTAVPYYRGKKLLDERPLKFDPERYHATQTPLRFPGKIVADETGTRLFISDSNHNRIVITDLDGKFLATIGRGTQGRADGSFATAEFNRPQGMALDGNVLYVADTENHLIRKVDLKSQRVTTVAGTGRQAENGWPGAGNLEEPRVVRVPPHFIGKPKTTAISSPWDVLVQGKFLYIAMAGTHQIWRMPLNESEIGPYAGNSREDIVDGPLLPREPFATGFASFAQPSGLATDGRWLFVADSEGSSIRTVPLMPGIHSEVRTVVGTADLPANRLFTFGDVDGTGPSVRLQHPLGITYHNGLIYVADTYNNKIKAVDPAHGTVSTIAGSGAAGHDDAAGKPGTDATFNEPGGITYAAGKLFVADTDNHLIRTISLGGDHAVGTLAMDGVAPPGSFAQAGPTAPPAAESSASSESKPKSEAKPNFKDAEQVKLPVVKVKSTGDAVHLAVRLDLPDGWKINELAPMRYWLEAEGNSGPVDRAVCNKFRKLARPVTTFDVRLPVKQQSGKDTVTISMNYYYCQEGENGVCKTSSVVWTIPLELADDGSTEPVPVTLTVK
jgi:thiol-disulfide isomerase/thioredoxin